ncbi:MAG: endonuclease domain-containing protein [Candidatus Pacebacteria bacterium]|nr:endonuclease domain-containing protein [Candidatus Paceibacterota bacterium]
MIKIFNQKSQKEKRQELRSALTPQELKLWALLRNENLGCKFRRQHGIGPYIVDFYCKEKNLIIEIDGSQHQDNADYDKTRDQYLEQLGFTVVRFWNDQVNRNIDGVVMKIQEYL